MFANIKKVFVQAEGGQTGQMSKAARKQLDALTPLSEVTELKGKGYAEQIKFYREQIIQWQALRMTLDAMEDDHGHGRSSGGSAMDSAANSAEVEPTEHGPTLEELIAQVRERERGVGEGEGER